MFSFFKDLSGKVRVNATPWVLDQEGSEIIKDIHVFKGKTQIQRIQIRYVVDKSFTDGMEEGLRNLLGNAQHLGIMYSPSIGAGDGYLAFRVTAMESKRTLYASVQTSDQDDYSTLMFQERENVLKISQFFSSGEDVFFELVDMDSKLVVKFVLPNEPSFKILRDKLLAKGS